MSTEEEASPKQALQFPRGFLWGTATAAYQIEGACGDDGRAASWWDDFAHTKGKVVGGESGDVACDHYHRMESDVELMKSMGLKCYRFSISWPRVLPTGEAGTVNEPGVAFYRRLLKLLRAAGIKSMVTLYHWDLPSALAAKGGWLCPDSPAWFAAYAGLCFDWFDGAVDYWVTFNEPVWPQPRPPRAVRARPLTRRA